MHTGLNLGAEPEWLQLHLTKGGDFLTVLRADEPWPAGTNLTLTVGSLVWTAEVVGTDATFSVDKSVTDPIPDGAPARLALTNGGFEQVLAVGKVVRHG